MTPRLRSVVPALGGTAAALVLLVSGAVPAYAGDGSVMNQDTTPMSPGNYVLLLIVTPLAVLGLIWLLVSAPGWTRGGRSDAAEAWTGEPHIVAGTDDVATPSLALEAGSGTGGTTGGTSATW